MNKIQEIFSHTNYPLVAAMLLCVMACAACTTIMTAGFQRSNSNASTIPIEALNYSSKPGFFIFEIPPTISTILFIAVIYAICFSTISSVSTSFLVIRTLRKRMKDKSFTYSIKVQIYLYKALLFQISLMGLLFMSPMLGMSTSLYFKWNFGWNMFVDLLGIGVSAHASVEFLSQIYLIKPYRNFVLKLFKKPRVVSTITVVSRAGTRV